MAADAEFEVRVEKDGHGPVVWVGGELDLATAPALLECLQDFANERVTIDLSELTFMDSSGIAVLYWKHRDGGMILRGVQPMQMAVLKVTALDQVFEIETN